MTKQVLTFPRGRQRNRDDQPRFVVDVVKNIKREKEEYKKKNRVQ